MSIEDTRKAIRREINRAFRDEVSHLKALQNVHAIASDDSLWEDEEEEEDEEEDDEEEGDEDEEEDEEEDEDDEEEEGGGGIFDAILDLLPDGDGEE